MFMHSMRLRTFTAALLFSAFIFSTQAAGVQERPRDDMKEFEERIEKYLDIQKKAIGSVPSIPDQVEDPDVVAEHQRRVADAIRALRPDAKAGDVFTPAVRHKIAAAVKTTVQGRDGEAAKDTILGEGNPRSPDSPAAVELKVNAAYPTEAPLSTVPPSVLKALPTLPEELEFRFVGRSLILRDVKANIVVDILPNVM